MDVHVDETKVSHSEKCNNLHKASLVLSVLAILLTIALFLRMEISTQMLEVKVTLEIQEIKETLKSVKDARFPNRVNDHLDASSGRWYNFYIFYLTSVRFTYVIIKAACIDSHNISDNLRNDTQAVHLCCRC